MWWQRRYVGFLMKRGRKLGHITHDSLLFFFFLPPSPSTPDIIVMISFTARNSRRHRPHQRTVTQTGWQIATQRILFPAYTRQARWKTPSSDMEWEREWEKGEKKKAWHYEKDAAFKENSTPKHIKPVYCEIFVTCLAILVLARLYLCYPIYYSTLRYR